MTLALVAVGLMGLFIGARFLAPAILAATLLVAVAAMAGGLMLGLPFKLILLRTLYLILVLQGGYLAGLGLAALRRRRKRPGPAQDDAPLTANRLLKRPAGLRKPDRIS